MVILDYIAETYPDANIRRAKLRDDGEGYWVRISGHISLFFDLDGEFLKDCISEMDSTHVDTLGHCGGHGGHHHGDSTDVDTTSCPHGGGHHGGHHHGDSTHVDTIGGHHGGHHGGGHHGGHHHNDNDGGCHGDGNHDDDDDDNDGGHHDGGHSNHIDVEDLPTAITDYIAENYPDANIRRAKLNEEGEYIVKIKVCLLYTSPSPRDS